MHASDDMRLLREYASGRSEAAFGELVSRHINLVYSAALRSVSNPSQAEEITQSVFVTLASKAGGLAGGTVLSGWLYQTARLTARNFIRAELRRLQREQQAYAQSTMNDPEPDTWMRVGPLLEEAMAQLNEKDRNAIVLRYFEGKPLKDVGAALDSSEDAAKAAQLSLQTDLQSLLGDAGYSQYQNYQKNDLPDQTLLMQLKPNFGDDPLSDSQSDQLLQAMKAARQTITGGNPPDPSQSGSGAMTQAADLQEQMNQIVLQQAASFLTPAQVQTLGSSQSNYITLIRTVGPSMQKMFGNN